MDRSPARDPSGALRHKHSSTRMIDVSNNALAASALSVSPADRYHGASINCRLVHTFAVKPRACGAPLARLRRVDGSVRPSEELTMSLRPNL